MTSLGEPLFYHRHGSRTVYSCLTAKKKRSNREKKVESKIVQLQLHFLNLSYFGANFMTGLFRSFCCFLREMAFQGVVQRGVPCTSLA